MPLSFDVAVIGSGPAGITSAIYLKRANINVLMIDSNAPGGQLNRISMIENYPGFTKIAGADLAYNMFEQTQALGIPYKYGKVIDIIDNGDYKVVKTDKEEITSKAVIIASGRKPKELGLSNEKGLIGRGISWCAICDGALFKGEDVIVVGGGNSALEESLYLSDIVNRVNIVLDTEDFIGDEILQKRVLKNPKINVYYNAKITNLDVKNNVLYSAEIKYNDKDKIEVIESSGMFIYIGFEPSIGYANKLNLKTDNGYIIVNDNMHTNVKGIYACGDAVKKDLYQITTAVADGSKAAMSAVKFIGQ